MSDILNHFPGDPRPGQMEVLPQVEAAWDTSDVIVIEADTGFGKSRCLQTIAEWRATKEETNATLTPRVALQDQYKKEFPDVVVLRGKSRYKCKDSTFKSCLEKKEVAGEYCGGCNYSCDRSRAMESRNGVFSVHSYLMLRSRKDNLLIDEAASLYNIMADQNTIKLWQHKVKYPQGMKDYGDVIIWLEKAVKIYTKEEEELEAQVQELREGDATNVQLIPWVTGLKEIQQTIKRYERVLKGIKHRPTDYFIEHIKEEYRGQLKNALQIRPTTLEDSMNWLWPVSTNKVVLTSATFSKKDLEKLGLSNKRVTWIKAPPAIPATDRPIKLEFAGNMSYRYQDKAIPSMADKILELQARHADTKGLIHVTYAIAEKLKKRIGKKPNIIWHTKKDKEMKLVEFRQAPPGTIFIGCGLAEGLDLAGPDFGFQAICKMPWPSKADRLISYWYDNDFDWIAWFLIRDLIQMSGRVNRYKGDYAVTYILDSMAGNPGKNRRGVLTQFKSKLPKEFIERIV